MQYTARTLAAFAALAGLTSAAPTQNSPLAKRDFNAKASNNVAAWWGNSPKTNAASLDKVCAADFDIVILTFATSVLPSVKVDGGAGSKDLKGAIQKCQSAGKKVLMSLGGANSDIKFSSDAEASQAADNVAKSFLKADGGSYYGVALDGIDIDNENHDSAHWKAFVDALRKNMSDKQYISGAPQCPSPDASISPDVVSALDFVFVQFYNNGPCNHGASGFAESVKTWSKNAGKGQLYIGTPGDSASAGSGYIQPDAMAKEVAQVKAMNLPNFGGYAIWDGSTAIVNNNYQSVIKKALGGSTSSGGSGTGGDKPTTTKPATKPSATGKGQDDGGDGTPTVQATSTVHVTSTQFQPTGAAEPTGTTDTGSGSGSGSGASSGGDTQSCSAAGTVVCSSDGSKFGICNGTNAVMMAVSQGTVCKGGAIAAASA